jgi:LPS export ABC transporter protein LptC
MSKFQRRARLLIAILAIGFVVMLAFAFKRRPPPPLVVAGGRTDPNALIESTQGLFVDVKGTREGVSIKYDKQLTYPDKSSKLLGVTIVTSDRSSDRTFTVTAREALIGQNESQMTLDGYVRLAASDGLTAKTEHATYSESEGIVRAPGPVEFARKSLVGSGVGMTYDKNQDILVILDQAHIQMNKDKGRLAMEVTSPSATVARRERYIRFDRSLKALRAGQVIEADSAVARLAEDGEQIETVELRGNSRIRASSSTPGALQSLTGRDIDLKYAADGETIEHAIINGDAALQLAGEKGSGGRRITANLMDITLAPDGGTPVALVGREAVQLAFPLEQGASRTIKAANLDARGEPGRGLTHAVFTGAGTPACLERRTAGPECDIDYREQDARGGRAAKAAALEVALKPGMSAIEEATFSRNVRFEEGAMAALSAQARYVLDKGTLELTGTEPASPRPHIVNEQIAIDATRIDVTLEGPKMKAAGNVKSVLLPAKDSAAQKTQTRVPSMLKSDQPVNIVAEDLDYDGGLSTATYNGKAKLFQADTSVQGQSLILDSKTGDLTASGVVTTSAMIEQRDSKDKTKKQRVRTIGTSNDFKYEESLRRAAYTGDAHLSGSQGEIIADRIDLYLQKSGSEVDRAEAYAAQEKLTLREQNRKTTGARLIYTTANDTYVVTGVPVKIVDQCGRETIGQKLTFVSGTDTVAIEGGGQGRTQTTGTGKCS